MVAIGLVELILIAVVLGILIPAIRTYGFARVMLCVGGILLLLLMVAVPLFSLSRVEVSRARARAAYDEAVSANVVMPRIVAPVPPNIVPPVLPGGMVAEDRGSESGIGVVAEGTASDVAFVGTAMEAEMDWTESAAAEAAYDSAGTGSVVPQGPYMASSESSTTDNGHSATGQVVGGDSLAWKPTYGDEHVADLYSSPAEAARSLARRCGALLQGDKDDKSIVVQSKGGVHPPYVDEAIRIFQSELRRIHPAVKISKASASGVEVNLAVYNTGSTNKRLNVSIDQTDQYYEYDAMFVDKPWVRNDVSFRHSHDAPENYIVALGDNSEGGETALEAAAKFLRDDVEYYIMSHRYQWGYRSSEFPRLARVVAMSLTQDQFTQTFTEKLDGSRSEKPVTREAILLDYDRANLYAAITAAKRGVDYQPTQLVEESSARSKPRPRMENSIPMIAVIVVCCVAIKGVSRAFDR